MKTIIEVNYFLCVIVVLVIKHHNVQVNNLYTSSVRKVYRHLSYYNDSITYKVVLVNRFSKRKEQKENQHEIHFYACQEY